MKPMLALFAVVWVAVSAPVRADVYIRVETDGSVTLTDEPRGGYRRITAGSAAAPLPPPTVDSAPAAGLGAPGVAEGETLPFASLVTAAAVEHDLPEALLHAVIRAESNYDPAAVSTRGAVGLMQLMPATARELGVADARDPAANIGGGARYLKRLMRMFGDDLALALAAYNAGPAAVVRSGGRLPYAETRRYVPHVLAHFERLRASMPARPGPAIGGFSPTPGERPRLRTH